MNLLLCLTVASLSLASAAKIPGSEQNSWVDVCEYTDPVGVKCSCPPGARKEYLVVPENHDWHGHSLNCMLYGGWLTALETREEFSCVEHFVEKAYQPAFQRYAIALRSEFNHVGDYRWFYANGTESFPEFFEWADGHPRDDACVTMEIGSGIDHQGDWLDGECIGDESMFAICEREKQ